MAVVDLPLDKLQSYRPELTREPDFDAYWERALAESQALPLDAEIEPVAYPIPGLQVSRVFFCGLGGARICGWFLAPATGRRNPTLVQYHGYGGSKGRVCDHLGWALQGFNVFAMDTRAQTGESTDPCVYHSGMGQGHMAKGILDPLEYYYRAVYIDCVRAIDFVCARPEVDPDRIGLMGGSQGGGLTLAAAALHKRPVIAMPDVPFLCHYRRSVEMATGGPYRELVEYFKRNPDHEETAYRTLSYCDNMNLAPRIRARVLMSVGLQDLVCPPSTVYATYNHLACEKELRVYPYNAHEGGGNLQTEAKIAFARKYLMG